MKILKVKEINHASKIGLKLHLNFIKFWKPPENI